MALARVVIPISLAFILTGHQSVAQVNDHVHEIAERAISIIRQAENETREASLLAECGLLMARNHEQELACEIFNKALNSVPADDGPMGQTWDVTQYMAEAGIYDTPLKYAEKLDSIADGGIPDIYKLNIASSMADRNDWEEAAKLLDRIKYPASRALALTHFAVRKSADGESSRAAELLAEASKLNAVATELRSMSILNQVQMLLDAGMTEHARFIAVEEFTNAKSEDDWVKIIEVETMCGNVEGVRRAGEELQRTQYWERSKEKQIEEYLATAQANAGLFDEASQTAMKLAKSDRYVWTARRIAKAYSKAGRLDDAIAMIETIEQSPKTESACMESLLDISKVYNERGDEINAAILVRKVRESYDGWRRPIARLHGQLSLESEAETWIESLDSSYFKVVALVEFAHGILDREQKSK